MGGNYGGGRPDNNGNHHGGSGYHPGRPDNNGNHGHGGSGYNPGGNRPSGRGGNPGPETSWKVVGPIVGVVAVVVVAVLVIGHMCCGTTFPGSSPVRSVRNCP